MNKLKKQIQVEVDTAYLYKTLASKTQDKALADVFNKMSDIEERHAHKFLSKLHKDDPSYVLPGESYRAKILVYLSRYFGTNIIVSQLANVEAIISDHTIRTKLKKNEQLSGFENLHLNILLNTMQRGGIQASGNLLTKFEGKHKSIEGNELRAAVLGANDGLVSNLSLVMGVAGAASSEAQILLAGVAGLIAGSISMALGEWLSVQSSRELYQRQIDIEAEELENSPEEEMNELVLLYQAKGIDEENARKIAEKVFENKELTLDTLIREELGIDKDALGGSAWKAAFASFMLFSFGAILPIIPYFFAVGTHARNMSLGLSGIGLFFLGAVITIYTGKNLFSSGIRQVFFGLTAAAITFWIGKMIGGSL
jgi:VIT1/CCC1 family predicted Fe2+/Mn2+ transporter